MSELGYYARYDYESSSGVALADEPLSTSLVRYGIANNLDHAYDENLQELASCVATVGNTTGPNSVAFLGSTTPFVLHWKRGGINFRNIKAELLVFGGASAGGTITLEVRPADRGPDPSSTGFSTAGSIATHTVATGASVRWETVSDTLIVDADTVALTTLPADDGDGNLTSSMRVGLFIIDMWGKAASSGDVGIEGFHFYEA